MGLSFSDLLNDPRTVSLRETLSDHGELYIVGGAVRDYLMGNSVADIDYAYSLPPEKIISILEKNKIRVIPTGLSHQTVTVKIFEDLPHVEITSFRSSEMNPKGGVYLGSSIEEDLIYRDFTINALAIPVTEDISSEILVDPSGGFDDIQNKLIKTPGAPEDRFREDPLRILRMIRFACSFDFLIDEETVNAGIKLSLLLKEVSPERIRDEFFKIICSSNPRAGLLMLDKVNFYDYFIPELKKCMGFEQNKYHKHDVFIHTLDVVENIENSLIPRLAALFHDIGKPDSLSIGEDGERHFYLHEKIGSEIIRDIGKRLRFSNELISTLSKLIYTHMRPVDAGAGGLRRILRDTDPFYKEWRSLKFADTVAVLGESDDLIKEFSSFDKRIEDVKNSEKTSPFRSLAIDGNDLKSLGFKPGPIFKQILLFLHDKVLDNPELNSKDVLIDLVKQNFKVEGKNS